MTTPLTERELHILQHALGLDKYGQGTWYRNRFCADPETEDYHECMRLEGMGLMRIAHGPSELNGFGYTFVVTEAGISAVKQQSPAPPKLTRSQRRYRAWLAADCGMPFREWIKRGLA